VFSFRSEQRSGVRDHLITNGEIDIGKPPSRMEVNLRLPFQAHAYVTYFNQLLGAESFLKGYQLLSHNIH